MDVNRQRAQNAIRNAERELGNGLRCMDEGDHVGALKHFQESSEHAAKAVLIAYATDYPKVHGVGRFLLENRERFPEWFKLELDEMAEVVDALARNRPMYRYSYEYPPEEHRDTAEGVRPKVEKLVMNCARLISELFAR